LKGFGYVEFVNNDSVGKALKCDKSTYKNKVIQVQSYKVEGQRNEINKISSDLANKLEFVPRSIGKRKSKFKEKSSTNSSSNDQELDQKILNKSNKSNSDFRNLFNL